jgi:lipopolysaccharide cholinephosphotransferase
MEDLSRYNKEGSDLRKIQMRMLNILVVFDAICHKHHITYWLSSGTLLGARRHQGFIPWDDDLDIEVLQKDYHRLLSILKKELPPEFKLQTRKTDKRYWYYFSKIRDTHSVIYEPDTDKYNFEYKGIFLDIFPVEPFFSIPLKKRLDSVRVRVSRRNFADNRKNKIINYLMIPFYPLASLIITVTRIFFLFIKKEKYTYSPGIEFSNIFKKEDLFPVGEILFEGKTFNCPHHVDSYLIDMFGADFMQLPPVDKRLIHLESVSFLTK